ncbi:MAG TPA: hypothetical protein DDW84_00130 [Phycisphaerales bacterium]|nr:MAG: hypothetical protein A2Y13_02025 [Planctomycetes bacterium GWC2_45_44]HBG77244.1 hypothetical protein [Phycisphaerales bacterium]HBR19199.1 hypothetical protein [Phycisphaerales bacterium]
MIPAKYKVDFTDYAQDFRALADSRLLYQFKNSTVLKAIIYAFADEAQELFDAIIELMKVRTIYDAHTYYLEAIGRIIGQLKENIEVDYGVYFTPDEPNSGENPIFVQPDRGLAYVTGGRSGAGVPTDSQFALQVLARIFSNNNQYSSVPELQNTIKEITGINASFVPVVGEPMAVDIHVDKILTPFERGFLTQTHGIIIAEKSYYIAYPATLRINSIVEPS